MYQVFHGWLMIRPPCGPSASGRRTAQTSTMTLGWMLSVSLPGRMFVKAGLTIILVLRAAGSLTELPNNELKLACTAGLAATGAANVTACLFGFAVAGVVPDIHVVAATGLMIMSRRGSAGAGADLDTFSLSSTAFTFYSGYLWCCHGVHRPY